ncbi:hypothetical protein Hanom_Chr00s014896g01753921 [Helianthus anomalus]
MSSPTRKPLSKNSKFLQTCNRLSLFLKENNNIRDLNFGINAKFEATSTILFDSIRSDQLVNYKLIYELDSGVLETKARTIYL